MSKPAAWVHEKLVACIGGPYDHQWFTADDWNQRVSAAGITLAEHQRRGPALNYTIPSRNDLVDHPREPGARGAAARWRGGD